MIASHFFRSALLFLCACTATIGAEPPTTFNKPVPPAEKPADRFADLFSPPSTERAALSPDGKYLAYTLRKGNELSVVILEIDRPTKPSAFIKVITDEQATQMMDIMARTPATANIRWMRWVTATRLVMETNRSFSTVQDGSEDRKNTTGEIIGVEADGKITKILVTPKDVSEWSAASIGNFGLPRSPRIAGFCQNDPESVWIQVESSQRPGLLCDVERYKLNTVTGKLKSVALHTVSVSRTYLFDRDGRPQIAVPVSTRDSFPHQFLHDTEKNLLPWKAMDTLFGEKHAPAFHVSPANYFRQRSIPLGFGLSPDVLYYASNVGRETYGIYTLNLKTGEKGPFVAESSVYDLYAPVAGVFPDTGTLGVSDMADLKPSTTAIMESGGASTTDSDTSNGDPAPTAEPSPFLESGKRGKATSRSASLLGDTEAEPLIIDRFTHEEVGFRFEGKTRTANWFKPQLAAAQAILEDKFSGCSVELLEWDTVVNRFLVHVSGQMNPGAFYIYDAQPAKLMEFVQCQPLFSREKLYKTTPFTFKDATGQTVSGTFTFPGKTRSTPAPVVVLCGTLPWERLHAAFDPELQAYAEMGFAVVQVNPRRAWGFGWKPRVQPAENREEEEIAGILASVDQLAKQFAINSRRIALVGKSHGGDLALRALQLHPERFRCAIAIEPVLDIKSWLAELRWSSADASARLVSSFFGTPGQLPASSILAQPEKINKPVLLMSYRGEPGIDEPNSFLRANRLRRALDARGIRSELFELDIDYLRKAPSAQAEAFRKIEDFLNTSIYDYSVKEGELKTIELQPK